MNWSKGVMNTKSFDVTFEPSIVKISNGDKKILNGCVNCNDVTELDYSNTPTQKKSIYVEYLCKFKKCDEFVIIPSHHYDLNRAINRSRN